MFSIDGRTSNKRRSPLEIFKSWKAPPDLTLRLALNILEALDTPVSLAIYLQCKAGDYDAVVVRDIDPSHYENSERFYDDFIAISLLRKAKFLRTSFDKKQIALLAFKDAEQRCRDINLQILRYGRLELPPGAEDVHHAHIRKIHRILGTFSIDDVLRCAAWGPGVTLSVKGTKTSASHKFDVESDITRDAYDLYGTVFGLAYPSWIAWQKPRFRTGNVVITVPKNAKTDRTIAIEPGLNVWIQLGLGKLIRRRLVSAGYNLNSDLKNHRQAYIGSLDDSVATVDFKAASDTISRRMVELILPPTWFKCLDAARSHYYELDGNTLYSEKFSTMGNGFTFELESLIFVTLALALCECRGFDDSCVSIFGDDLTLPSQLVPELTAICRSYGFQVNVDKTFARGPFRESCGSYYFNGSAVKPLFLKERIHGTKHAYRTLNQVKSLAHTRNSNFGCWRRLQPVYNHLLHAIPRSLHFFGPASGGDSVIHANLAECQVRPHPGSWEGFLFSGFPERTRTYRDESFGRLLAGLSGSAGEIAFHNDIPLRSSTRTVFTTRLFASQWYDFGEWV